MGAVQGIIKSSQLESDQRRLVANNLMNVWNSHSLLSI